MATQTLNRREANTLLVEAEAQHETLARQFSELQARLTRTEPGSEAFTVLAHQARDMKGQLQQLTAKIQGLEQQATTDAERKAKADREAEVAAARAEAESQGREDLSRIEALIATINSHSDGLAAAIAEYDSLTAERRRLIDLGWMKFDSQNRSARALIEAAPYILRWGDVARMVKRGEIPSSARV